VTPEPPPAFTFARPQAPKATLRDVAAAAGVSLATASRALSRPGMVSPRVLAVIEAKCRELNYLPNHAARALSLERSQAVGVIVPLLSNHVFAAMIDGIQDQLDPLGFGLLINCSHRDPARELAQARALVMRGVDAMILGNPEHRPETLALLERAGVPYICAGSSATAPERPLVTYDSAAAMVLAVDHVVAAGHRRIAVLSGPATSTPVIADRLRGALARLDHHGLAPRPDWVVEEEYSPQDARRGAARLLAGPARPSAVVCTGDMHAMAMLTEARRTGIGVPEELSITGCNDTAIAHYAYPALTTIRTPYQEIGRLAAAQALDLLQGKPIAPKVLLRTELVCRDSVAAPKP
jgi:LacI family transcriptional regulator